MLDPVSVALANAPYDYEPVSEEEARDIVAARAADARGEIDSNEEVLAEFGLTAEDFERMGQIPLEPELSHPQESPGREGSESGRNIRVAHGTPRTRD
jgi:hypothetical protein